MSTTSHTAPEIGEKTANESVNVAVSFANRLVDGEALTGTPTVTCTPSGLTVNGEAVNTSVLTLDDGTTVAIGEGVQFTVSAGTAGTTYSLSIVATTDADVPQTLEGFVTVVMVSA